MYLGLQLQPGSGFQGVLQPRVPLTRLQLYGCMLLDGAEGLSAALALLPGLQYLSICATCWGWDKLVLLTDALTALQQLTYLELADATLQGPDEVTPALQPLQSLTRLIDLRLAPGRDADINSSMLSAMQHLTRFGLIDGRLEPVALTTPGGTHLQHLELAHISTPGGAGGTAQLLSQLQRLQQLTHLELSSASTLTVSPEGNPPAAAFSALTASSKLQCLNIRHCTLPAAVWHYMFPAGRQLPQLRSLDIACDTQPDGTEAAAPEGTRLVSCCPALQALSMQGLQYSAELLTPLQRLSGLHTLTLARHDGESEGEILGVAGRLTGLRELELFARCPAEVLLQQLTQLKQLTKLVCKGDLNMKPFSVHLQEVSSVIDQLIGDCTTAKLSLCSESDL